MLENSYLLAGLAKIKKSPPEVVGVTFSLSELASVLYHECSFHKLCLL